MRGGWTYIMTNHVRGVPYIGVTADLAARVAQHRAGEGSSFCRKYNLKRLVLAEHHDTIEDAIRREKILKTWKRAWKIELIEASNPQWPTCGKIWQGHEKREIPLSRIATPPGRGCEVRGTSHLPIPLE